MALPVVTPVPRVLRPRRATPADAVRPTRAEVNLGNLRHNLHVLRRFAGTTQIFGVLKADAYGHGAPAVARTLERAGIDGICVALLEEGIELREAGIRAPILVMGGYYGQGWADLLAHHLTPVVYEVDHIESLAREIRYYGEPPTDVHLKIDTGMARLGARPDALDPVLSAFRDHPEVRLAGMMTHFANADADDLSGTNAQCDLFEQAVERVRNANFQPTCLHAANSAALMRVARARYQLARPGIALFGVSPRPDVARDLRPVMRVRSEIVSLRTLSPGDAAGYQCTWSAQRPSHIATIPMGYADGIPRAL
ncbi:MAG: alanine racemase, partial [Polyangiaceae bacterium]|nr:alanine racemase [Polyangiaceae bacterium]